MRRNRERPRCEHRLCILTATEGKWCWFHARVVAGLIDPVTPSSYNKGVLDQARRTEMARLKREIGANA